jgi:hypothetical protein
MNQSAAVPETLSFDQHCTESKDGYGPAPFNQLSSKNLDCQSKSGYNTEEYTVTTIKDVKSNIVSNQFDQPKINPNQSNEANNLVNIPTQHMDRLAAVWKTLNFNQHYAGSKSDYIQALQHQLLSKKPICVKLRRGFFEKIFREGKRVFNLFIFESILVLKFAEQIINTFRCSKMTIYIFTEGFHANKKNGFLRTPVNSALLSLVQYHEASRRTATEQMGSPLRSVFRFMFKIFLIR